MNARETYLRVENERLRAENAALRKALRINGRHARRIGRAYDAAMLLAVWHCGHLPTSRHFAHSQGMGQRQWQNGITLLRMARICDQRNRWAVHELPAIEAALKRAAVGANAAPDAYFARGPRHMRR